MYLGKIEKKNEGEKYIAEGQRERHVDKPLAKILNSQCPSTLGTP